MSARPTPNPMPTSPATATSSRSPTPSVIAQPSVPPTPTAPIRTRPGPDPDPSAEEADMTVHRTRLHTRTRPRHRPARPGPAGPSRQRAGLRSRLLARLASEQGDVPGWVLITLMTAGIVVALWAVASDQIVQIFENAMAPFLGGSL